jgi:pimeloyl-ACP methyl ester carboxylesterase
MRGRGLVALLGAAGGLVTGISAEHVAVARRRTADPERGEDFGGFQGVRTRYLERDDGARILIREKGPRTKRGVVFVHGSALRADQWHYQMKGLGRRRLVFFDLRGHGRSQPKGRAPLTVSALAHDLAAVIEDAGLTRAAIVGHSMGGMVAMQLCHERPDLLGTTIKTLVLANATHRPPIETVVGGAALARLERLSRGPFDMVGSQHASLDRLRRVVRASDALFWTVSFAGFGPRPSASHVDFTYDMLAETPSDIIFDLFKAYRDFDLTEHICDIHVPVLVVAGSHDRITVPAASGSLAERLPVAELRVLDGCGHMAMMERHALFNEMLQQWLDDTL